MSDSSGYIFSNPAMWKKRTTMEKCLTITVALTTTIGLCALVTLLAVLYHNTYYKEENSLCLTPGCIYTASKVLENMDPKVDPCDDFYRFSCGNFVKKTSIPDDQTSVTSFSITAENLQKQLRIMIEEPIDPKEPKPFQLTKKLYQACMNTALIEKDGLNTIHAILKQLGGWPVIEKDSWDESNFNWQKSVSIFRTEGYSVNFFISFVISIDMKNTSTRVIFLDQPSLGLLRDVLIKGLSDKLVKAYYDYMVDIAVLFGADKSRAAAELKESLEFEIKLANISLPNEQRRNEFALYNPMTVQQLQNKYSSIQWIEYINAMLAPDVIVNQNERVIVREPQFLADFENLIAETPKRIQANYVMWRAVDSTVPYLNEAIRKRQLEYSTTALGTTEKESRWKECVDNSAASMHLAVGALYVQKYFYESARQNALEIVDTIRQEFEKLLESVDWMDDKTKHNAFEKARAMSFYIGYPVELLDNKKIEEFYDGLELDKNQYLESMINLTLFATRYLFQQLKKPVNKTDWVTHGTPTTVNAFYNFIDNSIQLPAGILQGVFFNAERPRYMNYGAIGFIIGHEITHGFDDQGRQFDKEGNLDNWWAQSTLKAFLTKAQCIIDQYGNFTVPKLGINVNGKLTLGENIADNGGIKESYLAYNTWVKKHGKERNLPGLKYTPNQMFWISASNMWCSVYRPETLKMNLLSDYHSPSMFRVNGPMSNIEYFARDFNCPTGSKMNPDHKCKVW